MFMDSTVPFVPMTLCLVAVAAFVLPGYGWATWLHRDDGFSWSARLALGFAWSMAVFGLLSWPFLWYRLSFSDFLRVLYPAWAVFSLIGAIAYAVAAWHDRRVEGWKIGRMEASTFQSSILAIFHPSDDEPAPWTWSATAAALILLQAISSVIYVRADWDDCFYLAAALDYQHAESFNDQEPTHREGFPMSPIYWALCWELWGAVLCHLSGSNPLVVFHSVLPGFLVLVSYTAYTALLAEYVPRRWVPLALIGLSAFHLWGSSCHDAAANFLLPRPWQGKAVLLHIAIPLTVLMLNRFADRTDWRHWLSLCACLGFGLAVSFSGIFMGVVLIGCLAPSLVLSTLGCHGLPAALARGIKTPSASRQPVPRLRLRFLTGAVAATWLLVVAGLAIYQEVQAEAVFQGKPFFSASWFETLGHYTYYGSAEIVWLLSLPLLPWLLPSRKGLSYLVVFPIVLGLTFANPLMYDLVAANLTSYYTYFRLWWLFPVGMGLAAFFALAIRFCMRVLPATPGASSVLPLVLALAGFALTYVLPGLYIWSPRNNFIGQLSEPQLAENLEKMPGDLKPLAERLARDPEIRDVRILCWEEVASFLTPYSRDLRFVQTRTLYTPLLLAKAGRPGEGLERFLLASVMYKGRYTRQLTENDQDYLNRLYGNIGVLQFPSAHEGPSDVGDLLARYRVKYIVTVKVPYEGENEPVDISAKVWRENGYSVAEERGLFTLWQRETPIP